MSLPNNNDGQQRPRDRKSSPCSGNSVASVERTLETMDRILARASSGASVGSMAPPQKGRALVGFSDLHDPVGSPTTNKKKKKKKKNHHHALITRSLLPDDDDDNDDDDDDDVVVSKEEEGGKKVVGLFASMNTAAENAVGSMVNWVSFGMVNSSNDSVDGTSLGHLPDAASAASCPTAIGGDKGAGATRRLGVGRTRRWSLVSSRSKRESRRVFVMSCVAVALTLVVVMFWENTGDQSAMLSFVGSTQSRIRAQEEEENDVQSTYSLVLQQTHLGAAQQMQQEGQGGGTNKDVPETNEDQQSDDALFPLLRSAFRSKNGRQEQKEMQVSDPPEEEEKEGGENGSNAAPIVFSSSLYAESLLKPHKDEPDIPEALLNLASLEEAGPFDDTKELPYFWDVHFSGETVAEIVFGRCHGLVQACELGLQQPGYNEQKLEVFHLKGLRYVNVDTTTKAGLQRARSLRLAESSLAQVVSSPALHDVASTLFGAVQGRLFALFRHPVERAVSMYYYLAGATWDPMYHPQLKEMTLVEYAQSDSLEHNWMTRFLVGKPTGGLQASDILLAKRIVREKCLVGLFHEMEASLARFEKFFGWTAFSGRRKDSRECRRAFVAAGDKRHRHPMVEPNSKEWNLIAASNRYDMELYEYAKLLWRQQGAKIFGVE